MNKEYTTPNQKELTLKPYLTGRAKHELRQIMTASSELDTAGNVKGISGSTILETETKLIELLVVSYDGSEENVLDRILDAPSTEMDFVLAKCDEITSGKSE